MHWKQESPHNALRKQLCSITDHLKCLNNYELLKLKKRTNLCGGYWNQIMIQIMIVKESCDLFGSWRTLSATYRISKFSKGACPWTPLGEQGPLTLASSLPGCQTLSPSYSNLNETPAVVGLFIQLSATVSRSCCLGELFSKRSLSYAKITLKRVRRY